MPLSGWTTFCLLTYSQFVKDALLTRLADENIEVLHKVLSFESELLQLLEPKVLLEKLLSILNNLAEKISGISLCKRILTFLSTKFLNENTEYLDQISFLLLKYLLIQKQVSVNFYSNGHNFFLKESRIKWRSNQIGS